MESFTQSELLESIAQLQSEVAHLKEESANMTAFILEVQRAVDEAGFDIVIRKMPV